MSNKPVLNSSLNKIVIASHNVGKLKEFQALFAGTGIDIVSAKDFAVSDVEETGVTFVENALIKARHVAKETGLPAIADDSGLIVDVLMGQPGVFSARYSEEATDDANNKKLLQALTPVKGDARAASFHCVLTLLRHAEDPIPLIAHGIWHGRILDAPRGDNGFGYDPLFWIENEHASSAELPLARKNQLSHRAQALRKLLALLS